MSARRKFFILFVLWMWAGCVGSLLGAAAAPTPAPGTKSVRMPVQDVKLLRGKSQVFNFKKKIKRVSVANPKVAEAMAASPWNLIMNGKGPGTTSVLVWDESGTMFSYDVKVAKDVVLLNQIRDRLARVLPKEKFTVESIGTGFAISGVVASNRAKKVALGIGEAYAPKKVVDNIRVHDIPPQVMLKVRFAEIIKTDAVKLGWALIRHVTAQGHHGGFFPGSPGFAPTGVFLPPTDGLPGPDLSFSDAVSFFLGTSRRSAGFFLRALKQKGLLRTLAEPHLRVVSGQKAKFLAGGEVPVPVPGPNNSVSIKFKPFGVELDFKAEVLPTGYVDLEITPSVSSLDETISIAVGGVSVPGFKKSNTTTRLEMRDGQTIAISGLVNEEMKKNIDSIPGLGDIPILGALFRSKEFKNKKSELVVLVTVQIIRPKREVELTLTRTGFMVGRIPFKNSWEKSR